LKEKGGELLAISTESIEQLAAARKKMPDLPCVLASDPEHRAIETLNLLHRTMNKTVSIPSNILVDKAGKVAWAHYAEIVPDRPAPAEVLEQICKL